MSGGAFDYKQYGIQHIIDVIKDAVDNNEQPNEYGDVNSYSEKTIREFKYTINLLQVATIYTQRIDWLLSGDDGENRFHERLKEDIQHSNLESGLTLPK